MTKPSHQKNNHRWLVVILTVWLLNCQQMIEHSEKEATMTNFVRKNLWHLIQALTAEMPLSKDKLEQALAIKLTIKVKDENLTHWVGSDIDLEDNLKITNVNLVLSPRGDFDATSGVSIELAGNCVSIEQVREHYMDLEITQHPRGQSLQESTVFTAKQPQGEISFAFIEENPDCLFRVSFRKNT